MREGTGAEGSLDVIQLMARELANAIRCTDEPQDCGLNVGNRAMIALEKFKKLSPPTFNKMSGPKASKSWLDQIERAFNVMQLAPNLTLSLGTYQLID